MAHMKALTVSNRNAKLHSSKPREHQESIGNPRPFRTIHEVNWGWWQKHSLSTSSNGVRNMQSLACSQVPHVQALTPQFQSVNVNALICTVRICARNREYQSICHIIDITYSNLIWSSDYDAIKKDCGKTEFEVPGFFSIHGWIVQSRGQRRAGPKKSLSPWPAMTYIY